MFTLELDRATRNANSYSIVGGIEGVGDAITNAVGARRCAAATTTQHTLYAMGAAPEVRGSFCRSAEWLG